MSGIFCVPQHKVHDFYSFHILTTFIIINLVFEFFYKKLFIEKNVYNVFYFFVTKLKYLPVSDSHLSQDA